MFKLLEDFNYNKFIGDLMPLDEFIECVDEGSFIPYDGTIGDIIVDGKKTNIRVSGWNSGWYNIQTESTPYLATLREISEIGGKVEVRWCNK